MADKLPWGLNNAKISPGSSKTIPESKLKAFEVGTMNVKKGLSKREKEEVRRKQDEVAAAQVYEDFVASFQDSGKHNKMWVKGGTVNPGKGGKEVNSNEKGRIYKPTSKLAELAATFSSVKELQKKEDTGYKPDLPWKKKEDKKKSNLEMFKEELKQIQEERQERHKMKRALRQGLLEPGEELEEEPLPPLSEIGPASLKDPLRSSYDLSTDENTTNIYVGNINPKMTEQQLCEVFGKYGPLASVKIMWPRTDEERSRGRNCGFVAFMNRKDGERAMNTLKGKDVCGFEMKLGWGKAVPIPPHPVYIPPALVEMTMPPPPSGLPFNAQPQKKRGTDKYGNVPPPGQRGRQKDTEDLDKTLAKAVVKVVIPTERNLLSVIHRMVEFVVREGPMFEAMIMNRELNNPMFRFLFDNQGPAHIYYRWKLFTILQGDSPYKWRTEEFRMFKAGSLWKPPPMNPYTQGMPDELVNKPEITVVEPEVPDQPVKGQLTDSQRDRLEDMLRELSPERAKIGDAMVWCLDHAESAQEIVECIAESLSILQTPIPKKIARLFLVSDILFNSSAKVPNASFFRRQFQHKLPEIFQDIHETYDNIDGRLKAEQFKQKVMFCFRAWEDWAIYPNDYLINLQNIFLGLVPSKLQQQQEVLRQDSSDLDGAPIEDLDGAPIPEGPRIGAGDSKLPIDVDGEGLTEDLDGAPLEKVEEEDLDGKPLDNGKEASPQVPVQPKFASSKWETVDEAELEAQAMTTSKWDLLEQEEDLDGKKMEDDEDIDGLPIEDDGASKQTESEEEGIIEETPPPSVQSEYPKQEMSEQRRAKLREIELKIIKYQDELEAGKRSRKSGMSMSEQIEHHRKKLLAKEFNDSPARESRESRKRHRSGTPPPSSSSRSRVDSPKRSKRRSRTPKKSRRSRSRSRSRKKSSSRSPSRHRRKSKKSKHRD